MSLTLSIYWAGPKGMVWGLVSLSALPQRRVWNASPLQMGSQTTVPCAQAEDSGLLGLLQSPNWVKVYLISTVFFLPVSIVPRNLELSSWDSKARSEPITSGMGPPQAVLISTAAIGTKHTRQKIHTAVRVTDHVQHHKVGPVPEWNKCWSNAPNKTHHHQLCWGDNTCDGGVGGDGDDDGDRMSPDYRHNTPSPSTTHQQHKDQWQSCQNMDLNIHKKSNSTIPTLKCIASTLHTELYRILKKVLWLTKQHTQKQAQCLAHKETADSITWVVQILVQEWFESNLLHNK